jgi:hypothetical protein
MKDERQSKRIRAPLTKSWVIEIRPKTLVANMLSMSASAISPTCSTPKTNPALFTIAKASSYAHDEEIEDLPRMSTLRRSCGTLLHNAATCVLSDTSNCTVANFPPTVRPDSLWAARQASETRDRASARRATRMTFAPPWSYFEL